MSHWLHHDSGLAIGCPFSGTKHTAWALPQGHSEAPLVQKVQVLAGSKPAASPSWALNPQIGAGKGRALQAGRTASRRWPSCNPSISFLEWIPWKLEEPSFFIYFFSFLSNQSHFIGDQRSLFPSAFPFIFVSPLATKCPGVELDSRRFHDLFFSTSQRKKKKKSIERILILIFVGWRTRHSPHVTRWHKPTGSAVCCRRPRRSEEARPAEGTMLFLLL